jgi:selenocysteine lyase/cysteine desulfurase
MDVVTPLEIETVRASFAACCPTFESTRALDALREEDYGRLRRGGHVYLDYTGGGLYPDSQICRHMERLREGVFGNPHSVNPTSTAAGELVERTRRHVLDYFSAPADEYEVIFTANASQSLKLIGESYPFKPGDQLLLTFDNHNSVNGIREYDRVRGAQTTYVPLDGRMRISDRTLFSYLARAASGHNNLFAFPAQSNFSGVQHPLEWIEAASERGWDVLLDAAAFVPTNRLDLSRFKPDYVALSFYKMFGYPTGVGALVARHEALAKLHRPWFAGGTIEVASVQADSHVLARGGQAWEDGTLDYLNIPAVDLGLELFEAIGIDTIHERVSCLTRWLIRRILELHHAGGEPLVRIYGPTEDRMRGATVAMNFLDREGGVIDHRRIELLAAERGISLRTGCFCNPGAGEVALGLTKGEIETCFSGSGEQLTLEEFRGCIDPQKGTGAVRVSLGMVSTLEDVEAFIAFARGLAA